MQHVIKKQVINLSIDKKLDAFHIQQLVSNYYRDKIVHVLQQAFDAASNEEETISLDTLEIDLGIINEKEIEKGTWDEYVFKKISEQLIPVKHKLSSKENIKRRSRSLSISGQWIFYMRHGYLPWNILQSNDGWYNLVLEAFAIDSAAINNLRDLINKYPYSLKRIISQHSEKFLQSLIETLTSENQDALLRVINEFADILFLQEKNKKTPGSFQNKETKQKLWLQALQLAASAEKNINPSRIAIELLNKNFSGQQLSSKKIKDFLSKNKINTVLLKQIKKEKEDEESNLVIEEVSTKDLMEKDRRNKIDEEGIYLSNTGVVLLHPFLTRFFRNLQLIKTENFVDLFSQQKALYLLYYLATGNINPDEHELAMAKVLCAFPLEEPVSNLIELSMEELQEADDLLTSTIQQWEILKNTSPSGLREGFLQRNGKLFAKNAELWLQVETSSIDVLLDQLPWNLSMIKLPWMPEILKVEWR